MSFYNSLDYMQAFLRCSFPNALRKCRFERNFSQGDLANLLVSSKNKSAEAYTRDFNCWKTKISTWERGESLPSLETFFYLLTIFGRRLSDASIEGNKFLEEMQLGNE